MTLGSLIEVHGYWVLAVGCLVEGETIFVPAGFAAHRGYLDPLAVVAIASISGFLGDQCYFWMGRRHGASVLARWPSLARQTDRVNRLLDRFNAAVIIGVRFAYGLRIAGPVLIGTTTISWLRFALLNALGAILWACLVAGAGWAFGQAAQVALGEIRHLEGWLMMGLAAAGVIAWWIRRGRLR